MGRNIKEMRKNFLTKWKNIAKKKNVSPIETAVLDEQIRDETVSPETARPGT